MSEQMIKVRKRYGNFPETVRMRGVNVAFDATGEAEVPEHVAAFLSQSLPHEYAVADADGNYPQPAQQASEAGQKRVVVTDEERDMRGELAKLRIEAQNIPLMEKALQEYEAANQALASENEELRAALEKATASAPADAPTSEVTETPTAPAAPPTPPRRKPSPSTK